MSMTATERVDAVRTVSNSLAKLIDKWRGDGMPDHEIVLAIHRAVTVVHGDILGEKP